jgi:hypothetical protein
MPSLKSCLWWLLWKYSSICVKESRVYQICSGYKRQCIKSMTPQRHIFLSDCQQCVNKRGYILHKPYVCANNIYKIICYSLKWNCVDVLRQKRREWLVMEIQFSEACRNYWNVMNQCTALRKTAVGRSMRKWIRISSPNLWKGKRSIYYIFYYSIFPTEYLTGMAQLIPPASV